MRARVLAGIIATSALVLSGCGSSDDSGGSGSSGDLSLVSSGSLTVCSDVPYAPFEVQDGGSYSGFDIDLMRDVAKGLDLELVVKDVSFDGLQSGASLAAGQCDIGASAMTITKDREKNLDFSDPYYDSLQTLLVPTDSDIASIEDLADKKVGVQQGTTGKKYAEENVPEGTRLISFPSDAELYQAIRSNGIDAILQDIPVNLEHTKGGEYKIVEKYDTNEQYGFAVKEKGNEALLKAVNDELATLKDNGSYKKLYDKYFSGE